VCPNCSHDRVTMRQNFITALLVCPDLFGTILKIMLCLLHVKILPIATYGNEPWPTVVIRTHLNPLLENRRKGRRVSSSRSITYNIKMLHFYIYSDSRP